MVAYDASFWIRGKKIFTLKKYIKKLSKTEKDSGLPQLEYSSSKGLAVRYKYYLSEEENSTKLVNLDYYRKFGLLLKYQEDREFGQGKGSLTLGKELDKDKEPFEAWPNLSWEQKSQKLANTSWSYNLGAGGGFFQQKGNSTWRITGAITLNNNPIRLAKQTQLNLGTDYRQNWYGNKDNLAVFSYQIGVNQRLSPGSVLAISYIHRDIRGRTPFNFDNPGRKNELVANLEYQIDQDWKVGIKANYDLDTKDYTHLDYTVTRKLHCFETTFVWREKQKELSWRIDLLEF